MEIISHRGYWKLGQEKNSPDAFQRSFSLGFGTETDIRDYNGNLVISHDIANEKSITVNTLFGIYKRYNRPVTLALNIKADNLQSKMKELIEKYNISRYFVFDMSIPDTIGYINHGIQFFSRQSEYELNPAFYTDCSGIWLDAFTSTWYDNDLASSHISHGKQVAIVSPELHQRNHLPLWQQLKEGKLHQQNNVILCTDIPEQAAKFFNEY